MTTDRTRDIQAWLGGPLLAGVVTVCAGLLGTWMWHTQTRQETIEERQVAVQVSMAATEARTAETLRQVVEIMKNHEQRLFRLEGQRLPRE